MTLESIRRHIQKYPKFASLIGGVIASLTQPPTFYIWALLGFSLFFYLIYSAKSMRAALARNFFFSLGYFGHGFYWTAIAISIYIEQFWWAIPIAFFGLPFIFILFTNLIIPTAWKFRNNRHYVIIFASLWIFIEWLTSWICTGLPWMLIGHISGFSDIAAQSVSIVGIFGLGLIYLTIAGSFYYLFDPKAKLKKPELIYSLILVAIMSLYGYLRLEKYPIELETTRVRIVQPSIPQGDKWEEDKFWNHLKEHKYISRLKTQHKPDIIIWSEAAIMAPYQIRQIRDFLNIVVKENDAILLTGAVSRRENRFYTSMIGLSPESKILFEYNKKHLVPFGEYIPMRDILPINKLTPGIEDYSFGEGEEIFNVAGLKIRPLICYESIFPHEVRTGDADLFINITNSSWYGNSSAPHHLFYVNKFRAIENSTPVIISANSGISGAFDSLGREIAKTSLDDVTGLDIFLPRKIQAFSPYALLGLIIILPLVVFLQGLSFITRKIAENKPSS